MSPEEERWILIVIEEGRKSEPAYGDESTGKRSLAVNAAARRAERVLQAPVAHRRRSSLRNSSHITLR